MAKWTVEDNLHINLSDKYQLCTVLDGQGQVTVGDKAWDVKAADAFILPSDLSEVTLTGQFSLMVAEEA